MKKETLYRSRYITGCWDGNRLLGTRITASPGGSYIRERISSSPTENNWSTPFTVGWGQGADTWTAKELAEACEQYPAEGNPSAYRRVWESGGDLEAITNEAYWGYRNGSNELAGVWG